MNSRPRHTEGGRHQVGIWLDDDDYQRLKQWAEAGRRKISTAGRVMILDRLDHDEQFARDAAGMAALQAGREGRAVQ